MYTHYLKKSIKIPRFYGIGLLISILIETLLRSVNENFKVVYDFIKVVILGKTDTLRYNIQSILLNSISSFSLYSSSTDLTKQILP